MMMTDSIGKEKTPTLFPRNGLKCFYKQPAMLTHLLFLFDIEDNLSTSSSDTNQRAKFAIKKVSL